jgi:hypothetical protein
VLAQTLFLVAMIAIVATSAVAGIAGYARAEVATAAKALVQPAIDAALARYETTVVAPAIAAAYQPGDGSAPPAAASPLNGGFAWNAQQYVLAPDAPSPLAAVVSVTPTATSVPACVPSGASINAGPDTEREGQCSAFVQETRLSVTIDAEVGPVSGATTVAPIAHGVATVTLRLFAEPPYVMVAGIADDPAPGDPHEADAGGYGNALGAFGPAPPPDDTTIHVIFACTQAVGDCSASNPVPHDLPTTLPWTNGNANPSS